MKTLSVAMFPYLERHPYTRLLADALDRCGIDIDKKSRWCPVWLWRRRRRISVLHFHWPSLYYQSRKAPLLTLYRFPLFFMILSLARLFHYKIVWTVHNLYPHESVLPGFIERRVRSLWVKKYVDHMIVHCSYAERKVKEEFGPDKSVTVIPHGHFIGCHKDTIRREEARRLLNLSMDDFVYLHFGLLKGYKGIDALMEAFNKIKGPKDILIVAGKPVDRKVRERIEASADPQCLLRLFEVPDDEVQIYFKACDVVVLPYKDILTSGNLLLAMSFSRPVIIPAVGCVPETIDSECGILYQSEDPGGLEKSMRDAKGMDLEKMGRNALEKMRRLDWDQIAEMTKQVYEQVNVI